MYFYIDKKVTHMCFYHYDMDVKRENSKFEMKLFENLSLAEILSDFVFSHTIICMMMGVTR